MFKVPSFCVDASVQTLAEAGDSSKMVKLRKVNLRCMFPGMATPLGQTPCSFEHYYLVTDNAN